MKIYKSVIKKGNFILDIDDIQLKNNSINIIVGENGCGKSTLSKALYNEEIKCDASNITLLNQKPYVYNQKVVNIVKNVIKWNKYSLTVDEFLNKYDLSNKKYVSVKKLSGGEFRRLSLGLILCTKSKLLILDEPFVGIDIKSQKKIMEILEKEKDKRTIILISHKLSICKKLGSTFIFMEKGKIVAIANKDEFFNSKNTSIKEFLAIEGV